MAFLSYTLGMLEGLFLALSVLTVVEENERGSFIILLKVALAAVHSARGSIAVL